MANYREIRPSASLRSFVESFWILEHSGDDASPQRVVPDGHPELILNLDEPFEAFQHGTWKRQPRCFLAGQIDRPLLLRPNGRAKILGVRFRANGAARVLPTPMVELAARFTSIAEIANPLAVELDRALDSRDFLRGVEAALQKASSPPDSLIDAAVRHIETARGAVDLADLADDLGIGIRQLERRFSATVGLSPKLFCRMQRFVQVFRVLESQPNSWANAAVESGYYDQSHLVRDFREFAGETPAALLATDADLARHFLERFGVSHSSNTRRTRAV